jgi:transposase
MQKRYRVTLSEAERRDLHTLASTGKAAARKLVRVRILLLADQADGGLAYADPQIVEALGCGRATVERVRQQFVEEGLEQALTPRPTTRAYQRRLDGKAEAHLVAMACSGPPEGRARWTLRLLADRMVALGHVEAVTYETVRKTLQKTNSSRG